MLNRLAAVLLVAGCGADETEQPRTHPCDLPWRASEGAELNLRDHPESEVWQVLGALETVTGQAGVQDIFLYKRRYDGIMVDVYRPVDWPHANEAVHVDPDTSRISIKLEDGESLLDSDLAHAFLHYYSLTCRGMWDLRHTDYLRTEGGPVFWRDNEEEPGESYEHRIESMLWVCGRD